MRIPRRARTLVGVLAALALAIPAAQAADPPPYEFAGPTFGIAANPDGGLLVADIGAGIVKLGHGGGHLAVDLPGVGDMDATGRSMWAIASGPQYTVFRVRPNGTTRAIANTLEFEEAKNPAGGTVESNPFDVEALGKRRAVVADAAGNDLLLVKRNGTIDWIATLPEELVSTANLKNLVGCGYDVPPDFAEFCDLPPEIPAQPVATSVAIGPDGAYYMGELKGFPAPTGASRIWRVEPGARHAKCGTSPKCSVVADGFTSITDLFLDGNTLYVTEFDDASWAAVEFGLGMKGGTVNACDITTWDCHKVESNLPMVIGTAVSNAGKLFAAINILAVPEVVQLD